MTLTATAAELAAGLHTTIGNESFVVTSVQNKDGTASIQFVNVQAAGSPVATHPGSKPSVVIDGKSVEHVHGSTNFAKTVGYDVNANRSAIDIVAVIRPEATVTVVVDSIGFVRRGQWDFALD